MDLPKRVFASQNRRITINPNEIARIIIWTKEILKTPRSSMPQAKIGGKDWACGPNIRNAALSKKIATPIVLISGARWEDARRRSGSSD